MQSYIYAIIIGYSALALLAAYSIYTYSRFFSLGNSSLLYYYYYVLITDYCVIQ